MFQSVTANVVFFSVVSAVISYLLGSICFAIIVTKLFIHKDIRDFGSGNAGMTNVLRTVGVFPAVLTIIGDFLKAVAAIYLSRFLFTFCDFEFAGNVGMFIAGIFVVLGHVFPIYFGFRGGKGVMTLAGVFFVLDWQLCLVVIGVFLIITFITGYVSLGSIISMSLAPILTLVVGLTLRSDIYTVGQVICQTVFVLILAALSIFLHKENIRRLINGTENSFKKKKQK